MKFTKEIPTIPGHYWCQVGADLTIRLIIRREGELRVCVSRPDEYGTPLSWSIGQDINWAGPIPHPES